jgi:hypothetical protein
MASLLGARRFNRGDRLFDIVENICISVDLLVLGMAMDAKDLVPLDSPGRYASLPARQFSLEARIPICGPFHGALYMKTVDAIEIGFERSSPPPVREQDLASLAGLTRVEESIFVGAYAVFFERHGAHMKARWGEPENWPPFFRFCRAMRNAALRPDGRVDLEHPEAEPVSWHGLTWGPTDSLTRTALGKDLSSCDLLVLLIELSDELDRLGFPCIGASPSRSKDEKIIVEVPSLDRRRTG